MATSYTRFITKPGAGNSLATEVSSRITIDPEIKTTLVSVVYTNPNIISTFTNHLSKKEEQALDIIYDYVVGGNNTGEDFLFTNGIVTPRKVLSSNVPATTSYDVNSGYNIGSIIYDATGPSMQVCFDATPSNAIWGVFRPYSGNTGATGDVGPTGDIGPTGPMGTIRAASVFAVQVTASNVYISNAAGNPTIMFSSNTTTPVLTNWTYNGSGFVAGITGVYEIGLDIIVNWVNNNTSVSTIYALNGVNQANTQNLMIQPSGHTNVISSTSILSLIPGDILSFKILSNAKNGAQLAASNGGQFGPVPQARLVIHLVSW